MAPDGRPVAEAEHVMGLYVDTPRCVGAGVPSLDARAPGEAGPRRVVVGVPSMCG